MTSDTLAGTVRAAHDWGLASWLGGAMFGKFALNPSVRTIGDKSERGKVTNTAWNGYNLVNSLSLAAVATGWLGARATEARPDRLTENERRLAKVKDACTMAGVATGVATGIQGARLARQAPEGAVAVESGTRPAPETPKSAASIQRTIGALGTANIAAGVGIVISNALLAQAAHSRPPLRRALLRRSA